MWVTRKKLKEMLARAYEKGVNRGYLTACLNGESAAVEWAVEPDTEPWPRVLVEAEEILREKSAEGK